MKGSRPANSHSSLGNEFTVYSIDSIIHYMEQMITIEWYLACDECVTLDYDHMLTLRSSVLDCTVRYAHHFRSRLVVLNHSCLIISPLFNLPYETEYAKDGPGAKYHSFMKSSHCSQWPTLPPEHVQHEHVDIPPWLRTTDLKMLLQGFNKSPKWPAFHTFDPHLNTQTHSVCWKTCILKNFSIHRVTLVKHCTITPSLMQKFPKLHITRVLCWLISLYLKNCCHFV